MYTYYIPVTHGLRNMSVCCHNMVTWFTAMQACGVPLLQSQKLNAPISMQYKDITAKCFSSFLFTYFVHLSLSALIHAHATGNCCKCSYSKKVKKLIHSGEKLKVLYKLTTVEHAFAVGQYSGINKTTVGSI